MARWHWLTVLHLGFAAWSSGALARRALTHALTHPPDARTLVARLPGYLRRCLHRIRWYQNVGAA
jgi:hypothetical protein